MKKRHLNWFLTICTLGSHSPLVPSTGVGVAICVLSLSLSLPHRACLCVPAHVRVCATVNLIYVCAKRRGPQLSAVTQNTFGGTHSKGQTRHTHGRHNKTDTKERGCAVKLRKGTCATCRAARESVLTLKSRVTLCRSGASKGREKERQQTTASGQADSRARSPGLIDYQIGQV